MITGNEAREIDRWIEAHSGEMIRDLLDFIGIPSVNGAPVQGAPYGRDCRDALTFSQQLLKKLGISTRVWEDCIIAGETPEGAPLLGILVHSDIVGASPGEWASDPFTGVLLDGDEYGVVEPIIYGRGASDNKGLLIHLLHDFGG